ncbi:hypothetical protein B484DRAFT_452026 [Ochromonadaceae sp. CCMP2298]|nr:hypothetical protein B484DRAFT_452026 [Ochromonadaceae sp. CCMP2298]
MQSNSSGNGFACLPVLPCVPPPPCPASSSYVMQPATEVPLAGFYQFVAPPSVELAADIPQHELASYQFINTTTPEDVDYLYYLQGERNDSGNSDGDSDGDRDGERENDVMMLSEGSILRESDRKRDGDEAATSNTYAVDGRLTLRGLIVQPVHAPPAAATGMSFVPPQSILGPSRSQQKAAVKPVSAPAALSARPYPPLLPRVPLTKKEPNNTINKQHYKSSRTYQCSRVFILKVFSSLADHLKTRSIIDIHCIDREPQLARDCFQAARHACCQPSYKEEQELYGGLAFNSNSTQANSNWTEAWQLVEWWEKNVMNENVFGTMQMDARSDGTLGQMRKARWSQALAEVCTTIRRAMTSSSPSASPSQGLISQLMDAPAAAVQGIGLALEQSDLGPSPSQVKGKQSTNAKSEYCVMSESASSRAEMEAMLGLISRPVEAPSAAAMGMS